MLRGHGSSEEMLNTTLIYVCHRKLRTQLTSPQNVENVLALPLGAIECKYHRNISFSCANQSCLPSEPLLFSSFSCMPSYVMRNMLFALLNYSYYSKLLMPKHSGLEW
jgi:hypothetical protein